MKLSPILNALREQYLFSAAFTLPAPRPGGGVRDHAKLESRGEAEGHGGLQVGLRQVRGGNLERGGVCGDRRALETLAGLCEGAVGSCRRARCASSVLANVGRAS